MLDRFDMGVRYGGVDVLFVVLTSSLMDDLTVELVYPGGILAQKSLDFFILRTLFQ